MTFRLASPEAIKSASQRALAAYWDRLATGRRFPAFTDLKPDPDVYDPKQLVVWNVEGEGRNLKFRALYQGDNVAEEFSAAWAGKTMEQVIPMALRRLTLDAAKECVTSGCLVYSVFSTIDSHEQQVNCERLLMPFGRDDNKVEQMLASLQVTSIRGGVRRKKILGSFALQADVLFSGKIPSGFGSTEGSLGKSRESRKADRRNILRPARINFGRQSLTCAARNISATGAAIEGANLAKAPEKFMLVLEMESVVRRCTVVWRKKTQIGVRFSWIGTTSVDGSTMTAS
jgi:hypothetical protein